ncbi:MAG: FkbM family methyltransferase [Bacteroidia bacterium]|nr:FkbM family methyltransferase [Bacteroidia bacterium]
MTFFSDSINKLPITQIKIFFARILYRIVKLFYRKDIQLIKRDGISYEVDLSEGIELSLFLFGNFQKHVSNNKVLKLAKDAVVFDIGANVGLMSLQFAQLVPEGRVYSFEPTHYAFNRLLKNISLNAELANRITPMQIFISAESRSNAGIEAFSSWKVDGSKGEIMHPLHLGTAKPTEGVSSVTLNEFCSINKINRIDFIKIDTDGHEFEILKGAQEAISKFRPKIIMEIGLYVMTEKGIDFSFYSNYFTLLKYKMFDSKSGQQVTLENHKKHIPLKGTIDMLAIPI